MTKTTKHLVTISLAAVLAQGVSAQDSHWNGTTANTLWSNSNNWTPTGVPPAGNPTTPYAGNVWLDAANGDSVITIAAGDTENPGVGNTTEVNNTIFGPEWGVTLNIYGTLNFDWLLFPVQNNPTAPRSYVNLFGNAVVSTAGAAMGIGDSWFYHDAPYVTMNLYSNAQYNSFGGAGLWLGGHLNIYDHSQFLANNYINMDFTPHQTDGTRYINVGGGTLMMPEGFTNGVNLAYNGGSGSVYDFIGRGIVRVYGKALDTNDLVISDNGTNTILTPVPLGGSMQRVYFQPLARASVSVGTVQQSTLAADYPSVTGVMLSSSEPGISPSSFPQPVYSSSNPKVVTVDTNGMLTAVSAGNANITAKVGSFTAPALAVTVMSAPTLIHEYKFSETTGTEVADSVPGNSPTWDGFLGGGATLGGGQVTLDGTNGYVYLPPGIVSGLDEITVETWASFPTPINVWANLFSFGNTDGSGLGENYINVQPHTGNNTVGANFGIGDPGSAAETDAVLNNTLDGLTNIQIVAVFHPMAGFVSLYTNGVLVATSPAVFNNLVDPAAFTGPQYGNQSVLSSTLGSDPISSIGRSLYAADPTLNGSIDEFRIYNGPLTSAQVMADYALGPNQFIGSNTNVTLTASVSGGSLHLSWPTASALVTLVSSSTLGSGAAWTPMVAPLTVVGGNYQATIPLSGAAQFFRLEQ